MNLYEIHAEWTKDLDISEETWNNVLIRVNATTSCTRLGLIQFKFLHRLHYNKVRLSKMLRTHVNVVVLLKQTLLMCFGLVPVYWTAIFKILSEAYVNDIRPSFEIAVLVW